MSPKFPSIIYPSLYCVGPRACLGRKFATVEAVCFLTLLLRDFEVEPLLRATETKEQWRNRVLQAKYAFTLGVADVPVRFVRRMRNLYYVGTYEYGGLV